jgi:fatty-acyl-CoA synthase
MSPSFTGSQPDGDTPARVTTGETTRTDRGAAAQSWRRALELTAPIGQQPEVTFPVVIERIATERGDAPALIAEHKTLSYRALAARVEHYANWALGQGFEPGQVVCLMMPNCPEYLAIWLGIIKTGAVVALINTNLIGDALRHAIDIVAPRHIIVATELADIVATVLPKLSSVRAWAHGGEAHGWPRVDAEILTDANIGYQRPTLADRALYIYTSGTTGLPKAASVSHERLMQWTYWFAGLIGTQPDDRMYNCLPMYHSVGGVVATGAVLVGGGAVVIRERFSARRFWHDIVRWDCTLFQYIGELCRYLVAAPPHPRETGHKLRLACGNGLRREVWEPFQDRFEIPRVIEFYASTEGSFSLYNCDGKVGAVGRVPPYLAHRFPIALIKVGDGSGDALRDADGFCVRCNTSEVGEAIGRLPENTPSAGGRFEGYTDRRASERKILRDVFAPGDAWYRSGDLMRKDGAGFFYFIDRIGDSFRWKGENVSTTEIEEVVSQAPGVDEAVVYGVLVPGAEGRAGMTAVVPGDAFDLEEFAAHCAARLPDYARPLFVRLCAKIDATGTFKPQKQKLVADGFDPSTISDRLYVFDRSERCFVPLDNDRFDAIQRGEMKF